ncbi:DUF58 domain-containing protein [Paenibacillus sp. 1P07SE]|uniref:DUF58 domain-containing protein n=1 Tax=Paenibacillus sp. 1P07SE TaxID=3132209 RepID=UPI0039A6D284
MNLLWLVVISFVLVILQTQVFKRFGSRSLQYSRSFNVHKCKEGETVQLVEVIANHKPLPMPWIRLETTLDAALQFKGNTDVSVNSGSLTQNHNSLFSLMPFMKITRKHSVTPVRRGVYELNSASLTFGDLLGWWKKSETLRMDVQLLVHPKPLPIKEVPLPSHSWQGETTVKRWIVEDPFIVAGVRDYQPHDPFHRVNWKATARTGRLQVRQQDYTSDQKLLIYLNFEDSETMWKEIGNRELIEQGIRYAAAIARQAARSGMAVGFGCNGRTVGEPEKRSLRMLPRAGNLQLERIYDAMARLAIERTVPFDAFLEEDIASKRRTMDYVILSVHTGRKIIEKMKKIERAGNSVSLIPLHPAKDKEEVKQAHA